MFTSQAYTIWDNTTIDGQIIIVGKLVVKVQSLCSLQLEIICQDKIEFKKYVEV